MIAEKLISDVVPPVKSSDTGQVALNLMDVYKVSHIPVVDDNDFLGLVSEKLIYDLDIIDEPIDKEIDKLDTSYINKNQHIFEVALAMYNLKLSLMPVLNDNLSYAGVITLYDLSRRFAHLFSLHEPGGVIILEMNYNDYSLVQISKIIEENGGKVLSVLLDRNKQTGVLDVILKLNKEELTPIIEAFNRFDYFVKAVYFDKSMIDDMYNDRYEQFIKYLNI